MRHLISYHKINKTKLLFIASILLLGLFLRLHHYSIYPQRGATSDEYAFAFLGVSLLREGQPISWSAIPLYKDRSDLTINKLYFPIVKPYLDHPPLFGLLVGGWSILNGGDTFHKVDLRTTRIVPISLTFISSILLFLIGHRLYGFKTALWALLIYNSVTIFIINSRVVVAESFLTTIFLATLYTFIESIRNLSRGKIVLLGILCGLAFLAKVLGVAVFLTIFYFLIKEKTKRKAVVTFISTFSLFVVGFILYGLFIGRDLFWQIQAYQAARNLGIDTLWTLLFEPLITNKLFFDGWYFWGFLCLFLLLNSYQKHKFIIVPAIVYLLLILVSVNETDLHGWYAVPLFPFMSIATSVVLNEIVKKPNWLIIVFLVFVGMSQVQFIYGDSFGLTPIVFRIFAGLLILPVLLLIILRKEKLYRMVGKAWFYLFILGNVIVTVRYIHPA